MLPSFLPLSLILTLLPSLALSQEESTTGGARPPKARACGRRNTPRYCTNTNHTPALAHTYLCGDARLGPTRLPVHSDDLTVAPVLATALYGYDRFGGLCPGEFLDKWLDEASGWWRYPGDDGFLTVGDGDGDGAGPIKGNVTLAEETLLDRFGSEWGTFVSPAGAPYAQRALPPSNLAGVEVGFPYNYHVYSVVKPLVVLAGPIAPWFGQPGAGVQYMLYKNVMTLIEEGYLQREDSSVLLP